MPLLISADSGTEQYIPFAKKKLQAWHAQMIRSGLERINKTIYVSDGAQIFIQSLRLGATLFRDKIRIIGNLLRSRALQEAYSGTDTPFYRADAQRVITTDIHNVVGDVAGNPYIDADWSYDRVTFVSIAAPTNGSGATLSITRAGVTVTVSDVIGHVIGFDSTNSSIYGPLLFVETMPNERPDGRSYDSPFVISSNGERVIARSVLTNELFIKAQWNNVTHTFDVTRISAPSQYSAPKASYELAGAVWTAEAAPTWYRASIVANGKTTLANGHPFLHPASSKYAYFYFGYGALVDAATPYAVEFSGTAMNRLLRYNFDTAVWDIVVEYSHSIYLLAGVIYIDHPGTHPPPWLHVLLRNDGSHTILTSDYYAPVPAPEPISATWSIAAVDGSGGNVTDGLTYTTFQAAVNAAVAYVTAESNGGGTALWDDIDQVNGYTVADVERYYWTVNIHVHDTAPAAFYDFVCTVTNSNVDTKAVNSTLDIVPYGSSIQILSGVTPSGATATNGLWQSGTNGRALFSNGAVAATWRLYWCWRVADAAANPVVTLGQLNLTDAFPDAGGGPRKYFLSQSGRYLWANEISGSAARMWKDGVLVWTTANLPVAYTAVTFLASSRTRDGVVFASLTLDGVSTRRLLQFTVTDGVGRFTELYVLPTGYLGPVTEAAIDSTVALYELILGLSLADLILFLGFTTEAQLRAYIATVLGGTTVLISEMTPDECYPKPAAS